MLSTPVTPGLVQVGTTPLPTSSSSAVPFSSTAGPTSLAALSARPVVPGSTFRTPLVPLVDEVLELIHSLAEGTDGGDGSEMVVEKIKEINAHIKAMRSAAIALPGGDMRTSEVDELAQALEAQAESRREILRRLAALPTPTANSVPVAEQETIETPA